MSRLRGAVLGTILAVFSCCIAGCGSVEPGRMEDGGAHAPDAAQAVARQSASSLGTPVLVGRLTASADRARALKESQTQGRQLSEYRVRADADGAGYVADNSAQHFHVDVRATGVIVSQAVESWSATLGASALVCESGRVAVTTPVAGPKAVAAIANRAQSARQAGSAAFSEWYENQPAGVEQGFTFPVSPCTGGGAFTIEVSVAGLTPAPTAFAPELELRDDHGVARLRYGDLAAEDRSGAPLPTTIGVEDGKIALHIDASAAVYPVTVDPVTYATQPTLTTSDSGFGGALAVSEAGDTLIVGAYGAEVADVYTRKGATWSEVQQIPAPVSGGQFGTSVAIFGDSLIVGSPNSSTGQAYAFVLQSGTWVSQGQLIPTNPASAANDQFGNAVAVSDSSLGRVALIGASGAQSGAGEAYVFTRAANGTWSQLGAAFTGNPANDTGQSVALSGSTGLISEYGAVVDVIAPAGAVFAKTATFTGAGACGYAVGISANAAVVGCAGNPGAAYTFAETGTTWSAAVPLDVSADVPQYEFGMHVAISGNALIVGAPDTVIGANAAQGAAHLFTHGATWTELTPQLADPSGAASELYGDSVAITPGEAFVGAIGSHSVFVYAYGSALGNTCSASTDCLSGFCSDGVCCNVACSGSCDACSVAAGASTNGTCKVVAAGSPGSPACAPSICNGTSASCAGCTTDSQCGSGKYCTSAGACATSKAQGAACAAADCKAAGCAECASAGGCVDGYCCNTACSGACDACSVAAGSTANGTCSILAAATSGSPACAPDVCNGTSASCAGCTADSQCASGQFCGSDGTCKTSKAQGAACDPFAGGECKSAGCRVCSSSTAGCVDGYCCNAACSGQCDACSVAAGAKINGTCADVAAGSTGSPACSGATCDGTSAGCTSCTQDSQCPGGNYCASDGSCQPRKAQGVTCAAADCKVAGCAECASTTAGCVDGVCCDKACSGQCDACSVASGAASNGVCAVVAAGSPGSPACGAQVCSGVSASCAACTLDTQCASGEYCAANGACVARKALGAACDVATGGDCKTANCRICAVGASGCVDGVCCATACNGACQACNAAGVCEPVTTGPGCGVAGTGGATGSGGTFATGGTTGSGGTFATGGTADVDSAVGGTSSGGATGSPGSGGEVNNSGGATGSPGSGGEVNDSGGATSSPGSGGATSPGGADSGNVSQAVGCSADGTSVVDATHQSHACAPYRCAAGACATTCKSVDDCADPNFCNAAGQCVRQAAGNSPSGCGCRVGSEPRSGNRAALLGALVALSAIGSRRRSRRTARR